MKNTIIRCKSKEEYKAVLKKLEDKGCMWLSGHKPTEITRYYKNGDNLLFVSDDRITTGSSDPVFFDKNNYKNYEYITADDFIGNKPIVIYRVGRTVVALNQNTDETGVAKCHPTDDFDFSVGAKLAFERLLNHGNAEVGKEKPEEPKKVVKFKVGDRVRVKDGLITYNKYNGLTLLADMNRPDKVLKITHVSERDTTNRYDCDNYYTYDEEMLELSNGFRVGDIVTVNLDTFVGRQYGGLTLHKDMAQYGRRLVINGIDETREGNFYHCSNGYSYREQMLKRYDDEITIGCTVEVTDADGSYTTYAEWVDKNVDNPEDKVRYDYGVAPRKGLVGKVIAIAPHCWDDRNLVYFERDDKCYLINVTGVKKV